MIFIFAYHLILSLNLRFKQNKTKKGKNLKIIREKRIFEKEKEKVENADTDGDEMNEIKIFQARKNQRIQTLNLVNHKTKEIDTVV